MADLFNPGDIATSFQRGQMLGMDQRREREAEQKQSRLAALAQQAYADPSQRQGLIGQAVGIDPQAGFALDQQFQAGDDAREKTLLSTARLIDSAPPEMKEAIYQRVRPQLESHLPGLPPTYSDQVGQGVKAFIASRSGGQAAEGYTLAPGSARYDATGNLIVERPFAPQRPDFQLYDSADGPVWLPKPGAGGMPGPTPQTSTSGGMPAPSSGAGASILGGALNDATGQGGAQLPGSDPFASLLASVPGLRVTSQKRTPEENARLPNSVPNSFHLTGEAIDIGTPSPQQTAQVQQWADANGYEVIRNYRDGHIHVEPRGRRPGSPAASPSGGPGVNAIPIGGVRPKPKAESEESFGQPQPVTDPATGKTVMVQFGNRGGRRMVNEFAPPPTSRDAKPPTEGERNAAGYLSRMESAERELEAVVAGGYDPGNLRDQYTAGNGLLNFAASDLGQQYRQQQEDWVRAKLRKESGAVIGDEEMAREIKVYFPQPGDGPNVIANKAKSRRVAIEAMRKSGGRAVDAPAPTPQAQDRAPANDIDSLLDLYR